MEYEGTEDESSQFYWTEGSRCEGRKWWKQSMQFARSYRKSSKNTFLGIGSLGVEVISFLDLMKYCHISCQEICFDMLCSTVFWLEYIMHLSHSPFRPCIEYCCQIWTDDADMYLEILHRNQRRNVIYTDLSSLLLSLCHRRNVAPHQCLFYNLFPINCFDQIFYLVYFLLDLKRMAQFG